MCGYTGYHFGAPYPDACCIDGMLWDLDSCDEPGGGLSVGGNDFCPECETERYLFGDLEEYQCLASSFPGDAYSGAMLLEGKIKLAVETNRDAAITAIRKQSEIETMDFADRNNKDLEDDRTRIYTTDEMLTLANSVPESNQIR